MSTDFGEDEPRMTRMTRMGADVAERAKRSESCRWAIGRFCIFRYIVAFLLLLVTLLMIPAAFGDAIDETLRADGLEVRFRVSGTAITTAERVTVSIEAKSTGGVAPAMAEVTGTMGQFRVRDAVVSQPRHDASGRHVIREWRWLLEPYLPGTYAIPALTVTGEPADGEGAGAVAVETPSIAIVVASVLPAATKEPLQLKPLAPPVRDYGSWMPILLLVILVPPCVALVLRLLRGRERSGAAMADAEKPPPHEEALAELESIGSGTGGAERLHEVLCRYLQFRFNQQTRGRSIEELSARLNLEETARFTFERLGEQLQRARYGRDEIADRAVSSARELLAEFVRQTGKV